MLTVDQKEAQECEIDFPGSDVDSMARLLIFLYTDEYDEDDFDQLHSDHKDILCRWQVSQVRNLKTEARMYAVGDLYLVEPLMKHATKSFKRRLGQSYRGSEDEAFWSEMKEAIGVIYGLPANDGRHRDIKNILIIQGWRKLKLCGTANIAKPYLLEIAENSPEFVVDALIMGLQLPWVAGMRKLMFN